MEKEKKKGKIKKVIIIILLIIISALLIFVGFRIVRKKINQAKASKLNHTLNELAKERIDYVFIEINPSLVLTMKENTVNDVACLNNDCITIYENIDIKGKNINESIDVIYDEAKEKGFDVSNGVKVKSTKEVNIEEKEYITMEQIDRSKEKELLQEVKNNVNILDVNNDNYYKNLWEELKKDKDYDNIYTCKMIDKELKCYFAENFLNASEENNGNGIKSSDLARVLAKFGIKYKTWNWGLDFGDSPYGIYIHDKFYYFVNDNLEYYGDAPECEQYKNKMPTAYITCTMTMGYTDQIISFPRSKLNLLTVQYDSKDILHN